MKKKVVSFSNNAQTIIYTNAIWEKNIDTVLAKRNTVIITDKNVYRKHKAKFAHRICIVIAAGEAHKQQHTVDTIIAKLIQLGCDRQTFLLGVGGGVVTDITGYVASVFMRGIAFGFAPTSLLAMVDASIGGKNGVDVGIYKNIVGTINQPQFLFYDIHFLQTLPVSEWRNGFAEIIKHGAILNKKLFKEVAANNIKDYQQNTTLLNKLIQTNAYLKIGIVQSDMFEKAARKLLNFGHTLGHAIENTYKLTHGQAISIGMIAAAQISETLNGKPCKESLIQVFKKYGLPVHITFKVNSIMQILLKDKKKTTNGVHYVLLHEIGNAYYKNLEPDFIKQQLQQFIQA
jgi:3-dehydroquinate synthase